MALNEVMLNVSNDRHEGNQVKVSKSIDMFSTFRLVTRASVQMPRDNLARFKVDRLPTLRNGK
jgi:hypothetical protein